MNEMERDDLENTIRDLTERVEKLEGEMRGASEWFAARDADTGWGHLQAEQDEAEMHATYGTHS
jgi:hypothetical protein